MGMMSISEMSDREKSAKLIQAFDDSPTYSGKPAINLYAPGNFYDAWNTCVKAARKMNNKQLSSFYEWWAFGGMLEVPAGQMQRMLLDAVYRQAVNMGMVTE